MKSAHQGPGDGDLHRLQLAVGSAPECQMCTGAQRNACSSGAADDEGIKLEMLIKLLTCYMHIGVQALCSCATGSV